ncbi:MAG: carboxypeptidase-like regulatory domain-containing protein, partial [Acidobacteria bacterium]|nr:carboxypeptidase-like regulatory domain-containing protein [Acidobacteriota bacterium]
MISRLTLLVFTLLLTFPLTAGAETASFAGRGVDGLLAWVPPLVPVSAATTATAGQTTATLTGRILDASGAVLPGVTVTARNTDTGFSRST